MKIENLERNLLNMQTKADNLRVSHRLHIKTHKCIEIAKMQIEFGEI